MRTQSAESESCNCRKDTTKCPLDGQCLIKSVVYKATVTTNQPHLKEKSYHGMTEGQFKHRWYGHKHDITHKEKYGTTLSRHIWKLKDMESSLNENRRKNFKWNLNWEIKEQASSYQPWNKDCKLCIAEKFHILNEDDCKSLNVRSGRLSKCWHRAKWKLRKLLM